MTETPRTEAGRDDHETAWHSDDRIAETAIATHQWLIDGCAGCAGIARIEAEAAAAERERVVNYVRNEVGLDEGWESRSPGVESINPFDLDTILRDALTGGPSDAE